MVKEGKRREGTEGQYERTGDADERRNKGSRGEVALSKSQSKE